MKKLLFLLFFLSTASFACDDHPTADSKSPLWVKYLVEAASKKDHNHVHTNHKTGPKEKTKKSPTKKDK